MNSVRAIQQLNKRELEAGITTEGSWHTDYRDTAFIYVGGLPFQLSEGDIITIFSQYGEPVWIKLARDRETGKSRGFAWIKYEDQRSCDLAVDNLGGSTVMDRVIRVDHARYKPKDDEDMRDNTMGELDLDPGHESDGGRRKRRRTDSESDSDEDRPMLPEEIELERLMDKLDQDDPMRSSMIKRQQEKVDDAVKKFQKAKRKEKERARRHDKHRRRSRSRDGHRDKKTTRIKEEDEGHQRERHSRHRDGPSRSHDRNSEDGRSRSRDGRRDKDITRIKEEDVDHQRERRSRHRDGPSRSHDSSEDGRSYTRPRSRDEDGGRSHHRRDRSRERKKVNSARSDQRKERERRHFSSDDEDRTRSRSKRSPLPYRARSPRSYSP